MRKISKVSGMTGSSIMLVLAVPCIVYGIIFMTSDIDSSWDIIKRLNIDRSLFDDSLWWKVHVLGLQLLGFGVLKALIGIRGLLYSVMLRKNPFQAGGSMIVTALTSMIIVTAFLIVMDKFKYPSMILLIIIEYLPMVLFTLGGIFALIKEKPPVAPVQPPVE